MPYYIYKGRCIRPCFWQSRLWDVGTEYEGRKKPLVGFFELYNPIDLTKKDSEDKADDDTGGDE